MSETNLHRPSSGEIFETFRLEITAWLLVEGFSLYKIEPRVGKVFFKFNDPEGKAEEAQLRFQSGATVSANTFFDAIRRVRELVFDAKLRFKLKGQYQNANRDKVDDTATA